MTRANSNLEEDFTTAALERHGRNSKVVKEVWLMSTGVLGRKRASVPGSW